MPYFLSTTDADFEDRFQELLTLKREDAPDVNQAVAGIISDVAARGDAALVDLTAKFDQFDLAAGGFAFSAEEIAAAEAQVSPEDKAALQLAISLAREIRCMGSSSPRRTT